MKNLIKFCTFLVLSSCTNPFQLKGSTAVSTIVFSPSSPPQFSQKIYLDLTTATITEGSVIILNVAVDSIKNTDTIVNLALTSNSTFTRFNPIPAQITISAGQLSKGIILNTIDDSISQPTETWYLTATPVDPSITADPGQLTITLLDNDSGGSTPATAGLVQLKEFNPLPAAVTSINFKNKVIFANEEAAHGMELWISDGTSIGTMMLKDINPGSGSSNPSNFYIDSGGNYLYFTATTAAEGTELWRTDGTSAGTILLSDIEPGAASSNPIMRFKDGGLVYFSATNTTYGTEIWVSDGTTVGTHILKDIEPGAGSVYNFGGFIKWNSKVYFGVSQYCVSICKSAIFATDGTAAGTAIAVDKVGSTDFDYYSPPTSFAVVNTKLVFTASVYPYSSEIHATDGTNAGTYLLKDIYSGYLSSYATTTTYVLNGKNLVLPSFDTDTNPGFYLTDGTVAGTGKVLAGVTPNATFGMINGYLVFAGTGSTGQELWKTDGTVGGTSLLKDIYPGVTSGTQNSSSPTFAAQIGNKIFFTATTAAEGTELWVTDGTTAGTILLNDIYPGASSSSPKNFAVVANQLFFKAYNPTSGSELWVSDGTPSGTHLFKDINPGVGSSGPAGLLSVNDSYLFFAAYNSSVNFATIYVSDLTSSGTVGINHALVHSLNSETKNIVNLNGNAYFDAMTRDGGNPLWVSDGTSAGTTQIIDLDPNIACSDINYLTASNGSLFFRATTESAGSEIQISDGTNAGTTLLKDIEPGTKSSGYAFGGFISVPNNNLFFGASNATYGSELWVTDGTTGNTQMVADLYPGTSPSTPQQITPIPGTNSVIFYAQTGASTYQIFTSDGTGAGTVAVTGISNINSNINFYANSTGIIIRSADSSTGKSRLYQYDAVAKTTTLLNSSYATDLIYIVGGYFARTGQLYYTTYNSSNSALVQLWKTDGTVGGTVSVATLTNIGASYSIGNFADTGSKIVFSRTVNSGTPVDELWATDGTAMNTSSIQTFTSGSYSNLLSFNGKVYFKAGTPSEGQELWATDGTSSGTILLKDINPGTAGSSATNMVAFNGKVYFSADDGVHGAELWVSDGTPAGTNLLYDINPGIASSSPSKLTVIGGKMYFLATKILSGTEVWVYTP